MSDTDVPTPNDLPTPVPPAEATEETKPATGGEEKVFTQEDVDRILQARLGRAQKEHEKALADAKATAEMSAAEAAEHRAAQAAERAAAMEATLTQTRLDYAVRFAAMSAGVPADQVDAIVRLADTADALSDDGVIEEKVTEAVAAVVAKYPGLASAAPAPATPVGAGPATADPVKAAPDNLLDAVSARYEKRAGR